MIGLVLVKESEDVDGQEYAGWTSSCEDWLVGDKFAV